MGNCLAARRQHKVSSCGAVEFKNQNIVQLVKTDGNIIEFSMPVLVKDVLLNFSGFGIALARETPLQLPPNFKLRLGNKYYLIPPTPVRSSETAVDDSRKVEKELENGGVKRIKVVITKQQLKELLSKQVLSKDILSGRLDHSKTSFSNDDNSSKCWKPKLESIPEGNELI